MQQLFYLLGHFPGVWLSGLGKSVLFSVVWDFKVLESLCSNWFLNIVGAISDVYLFCSLALGCA
jgi:hypothetical protein